MVFYLTSAVERELLRIVTSSELEMVDTKIVISVVKYQNVATFEEDNVFSSTRRS